LAALIKQQYGTEIHRTTIMRGMKKTARLGGKARERGSPHATIRSRCSMSTCAPKHCSRTGRPPGPWNAFASMEWWAWFQAPSMTFRSSSTLRAFLVLPGAARGTFTGKPSIDCDPSPMHKRLIC
jgi:hypothetical protein